MSAFHRVKLRTPAPLRRDSDRFSQSEQQARYSAAIARLEYVQRYSVNLEATAVLTPAD